MSLQDGGSQQISRQDSGPLGCDAVSKGEWFLMIRREGQTYKRTDLRLFATIRTRVTIKLN